MYIKIKVTWKSIITSDTREITRASVCVANMSQRFEMRWARTWMSMKKWKWRSWNSGKKSTSSKVDEFDGKLEVKEWRGTWRNWSWGERKGRWISGAVMVQERDWWGKREVWGELQGKRVNGKQSGSGGEVEWFRGECRGCREGGRGKEQNDGREVYVENGRGLTW